MVVGADAPHARVLGVGRDLVVDRPHTRGGVHEPRVREVAGGVVAPLPAHAAACGERRQVLAERGRDDEDVGPVLDEACAAAGRDRTSADDEHAPSGQVQQERVHQMPAPASQSASAVSSATTSGARRSSSVGPTMPAASVEPSAGSTRRNAPVPRCSA